MDAVEAAGERPVLRRGVVWEHEAQCPHCLFVEPLEERFDKHGVSLGMFFPAHAHIGGAARCEGSDKRCGRVPPGVEGGG